MAFPAPCRASQRQDTPRADTPRADTPRDNSTPAILLRWPLGARRMCVCRPARGAWCPIQHLQHEQCTHMALKHVVFCNSIYAMPRSTALTMQSLLFSQGRLQCKGAHHCPGCPPLSFPTAVRSAGRSFPHSLPHVCCRTTAEEGLISKCTRCASFQGLSPGTLRYFEGKISAAPW